MGHKVIQRVKLNVAKAEAYIATLSKDEQYKKARLDEILTRTSMRPYTLPWRARAEEVEISTHPYCFNQETLMLPADCATVDRELTAAWVEENPEPLHANELREAMREIVTYLKDTTTASPTLGESMAILERAVEDDSWTARVQ